ncbi:PQQ-binding-like beta-propeller repeat protein [Bradyrhizobium vignae]|uniref:outer membrane protein assembly factor BamB family protein n=1 Tax=Bradyrhizobium vignae TaxID=1549949 RepID=UPI00100A3296|nr:PQQ-binding-like beta-propeller repeat protein [Bradyrhizobium vignae]RXH05224.1 cytochrome C oxidase Cbb3 [Bradyrhizobium vignae]
MTSKIPVRFVWLQLSTGLLLATIGISSPGAEEAAGPSGEALYEQRCASCHEGGAARAPDRNALRQLNEQRIGFQLAYGLMSAQGRDLSKDQIGAITRYLKGNAPPPAIELPDSSCRDEGPKLADPALPRWNGWGVDIRQHRFQPAESALLAAHDVPRLKLKWAFAFPGDVRAFAQPTVWGGRLFVGSAGGKVYALDARTGCQRWVFDAGFGVRSAVTIGEDGRGFTAYFGDQRGNVYALDAETGKLKWTRRVEDHQAAMITGAPTLADGILYVPVSSLEEALAADPRYGCCSFRGLIVALSAATGEVKWRSYVSPPPGPQGISSMGVQLFGPSGGAIWSAPTVDLQTNTVYATTGDSYSNPAQDTSDAFVAFDLVNGKLKWSRQMTESDAYNVACTSQYRANCPDNKGPDFDFGSSAILVDLADGKRALIAGQKSGVVHALDPDHGGAILWQRRIGQGSALGGVQWGMAVDDENVYVSVSDVGLERAAPGTPGAQKTIMGGELKMDPRKGGGLFALKLATGEVVWRTPHPGCNDKPGCSPAQSAAVTAIPGVVFSGGLDGHLRAYNARTGEIIWDVDTVQGYTTVNGAAGQGGSLDGPGAVIAGGMLYVNSGYTNYGTLPGNVLLAFSVEGR